MKKQLSLLNNKIKNYKQFKIFYINLKDRKDRLKFIKKQLEKNNLNAHRVAGIEPSRLDKKIINKNRKYLTPSGIALCLVHKNIWLNMIKKNIRYALILEDDVLISKRLKNFMNEAKKILDNKKIDIININTHELPTKVGKLKFHFETINTGLYDLISTEYGTAGYIISKEGAKKLVKDKDFLKLQIDLYLFSKKSKINKKLKIYQALPALTIPLASIKLNRDILKYHNFKNKKIFQKIAMSSSDYNNYINENKIVLTSNILSNFLKNSLNIKSLKRGKIYFYLKHYFDVFISNRQHKIIYNRFKI